MSFLKYIFGGWRNAHYAQGIRHFNRREFRLALREFDQVLEQKHMSLDGELARFYAAEAHARLGIDFLRKENRVRARAEFESAIQVEGTSPDLFYYLAVLALREQNFSESMSHAAQALDLSPRHRSAIVCLAVAADALGDGGTLARSLDRLKLCRFPLPPSTFSPPRAMKWVHLLPELQVGREPSKAYLLALGHHASGETPEALAAVEVAIEETPEYADLRLYHGRLLSELQQDQEALGAYDAALKLNPDLVDACLAKGISLLSLGRPRMALTCLNRGATIQPGYADIAFYQAVAAFRSGQARAAIGMLARALQVNPHFWQAQFVVGQIYGELGKHDLAVENLAAALRHQTLPDSRGFEKPEGMTETPGTMLQATVGHDPGYPDLRVQLGLGFLEAGDLDAARRELQHAVRLHPGYAQAHGYLGKLEVRAGNPEAAIPHFTRALGLKPRYADLHGLLGEARLVLGDKTGAAEAFHHALDLNPVFYSALVGLALVRNRQERHGEAQELLRKAEGVLGFKERESARGPAVNRLAPKPERTLTGTSG